jgi:Tfp pilus assembly protein PilV
MTRKRQGLTLVEVLIAVFFATAICIGLYQIGWTARRYAEYSRLATEARSRAKELLEELNSYSLDDLRQPSFLWRTETNESSMGYEIVRSPRVTWHGSGTEVVGLSSGVYAEVHVEVAFRSPLWQKQMTNTFSMIITE